MMAFDPRQRITAAEALLHRYFKNAPQPTESGRLPKPPVRAHNPLQMLPVVRFSALPSCCAVDVKHLFFNKMAACEPMTMEVLGAGGLSTASCSARQRRGC